MMNNKGRAIFSILIAGFFFCLGGVASKSVFAHGVVVFAWVEGDTVHVEGKFSGGRKAKGGRIVVEDMNGNEVLSGKTDAQGKFDFGLPGAEALKIVLDAGMGHRGEWTISAAEIEAARSGRISEVHSHLPSAGKDPDARRTSPAIGTQPGVSAAELAAIEAAVEKSLDRKLEPLVRMIADRSQGGPTIKDIIGGIGYILGLIGIAAYVHSRKRS